MKTVKEISRITGISVRTLHYYDEIDLLKPTSKSEAGYRLYDDKALERLQQILFFREFDIPLKEIKWLMDNPDLDQQQILQTQRKMFITKKERLERLLTMLDDILKGENKMDFTVFTKTEIEALCQTTLAHMPLEMRQNIEQEFGSIDQWRNHYLERCLKEDVQKGYQKMVEWYGDKETLLNSPVYTANEAIGTAFANRISDLEKRLSAKKMLPVDSLEIKKLIGEYSFVIKQFFQVDCETELMTSVAAAYRNKQQIIDQKYGAGSAAFFVQAIETFYKAN